MSLRPQALPDIPEKLSGLTLQINYTTVKGLDDSHHLPCLSEVSHEFFCAFHCRYGAFSCLFACCAEAKSETSSVDQLLKRLEPLEQMLQSQQAMLDDQKRKIAEQEQELKQYRAKLDAMDSAPRSTKTAKSAATAGSTPYAGESGGRNRARPKQAWPDPPAHQSQPQRKKKKRGPSWTSCRVTEAC